jgi:hypothetical protein
VRIIASIPGRLPAGADAGFDPEFPPTDPESEACRLRLKNLNQLLHFDVADSAISPTHWRLTAVPSDLLIPAHTGTKLTSCFIEAGFTRALRPEPEPSSPQA